MTMSVIPVLDKIVEVVDRIKSTSTYNNQLTELCVNVKSLRRDLVKMYNFLEKEKVITQRIHELLEKKEYECIQLVVYSVGLERMKEIHDEFSKFIFSYNLIVKWMQERFSQFSQNSGKAAEAALQDVRKCEEEEREREQRDRRTFFSLGNDLRVLFRHCMMANKIHRMKLLHENFEQVSRLGIRHLDVLAYTEALSKTLKHFSYDSSSMGFGLMKLLPGQAVVIEAANAIRVVEAHYFLKAVCALEHSTSSLLNAAKTLVS